MVNGGGESSTRAEERTLSQAPSVVSEFGSRSLWATRCSTPLPPYTQCMEGLRSEITMDDTKQASLRELKHTLVLSYISQQAQVVACQDVQAAKPPPYLSSKAGDGGSETGKKSMSDVEETIEQGAKPSLRPLRLPEQLAKRTQPGSDAARPVLLRPLLLPQDFQERCQLGTAQASGFGVDYHPVKRDVSSMSSRPTIQDIGDDRGSPQLDDIVALLNASGIMHSTPKSSKARASYPTMPSSGLESSLASTYGSTPSCSVSFELASRARDSLLLMSKGELEADWENEIISAYLAGLRNSQLTT